MTTPLRNQRAPVLLAEQTRPFDTAEEAWFWTMAALIARRDGARIVAGRGSVPRPCEPDDVIRCLDRLHRQRRIELAHARVLRLWGERGTAPDPRSLRESGHARLWREALTRLDWPLRAKGIVGGPVPSEGAEILAFPGPSFPGALPGSGPR